MRCPQCGETISDRSTSCPYCGAMMRGKAQKTKQPPRQKPIALLVGVLLAVVALVCVVQEMIVTNRTKQYESDFQTAVSACDAGNYEDAIQQIEQLIGKGYDPSEAYLLLGECYESISDEASAVSAYASGYKATGDEDLLVAEVAIYTAQMNSAYDADNYEDAAALANQILELDADNTAATAVLDAVYEETTPFTSWPGNAITYDGHTYAIYNIKEENLDSWDEAEAFCEAMDAHLAVIDSQEENDVLYQYVKDSGLHLAFFGYSDQDEEGTWKWVAGDSDYTNWMSGQPNNGAANENGGTENYAEFSKEAEDGTWNDAPFGANTYRFICEWDYEQ